MSNLSRLLPSALVVFAVEFTIEFGDCEVRLRVLGREQQRRVCLGGFASAGLRRIVTQLDGNLAFYPQVQGSAVTPGRRALFRS